jgi:hypothetical protein
MVIELVYNPCTQEFRHTLGLAKRQARLNGVEPFK